MSRAVGPSRRSGKMRFPNVLVSFSVGGVVLSLRGRDFVWMGILMGELNCLCSSGVVLILWEGSGLFACLFIFKLGGDKIEGGIITLFLSLINDTVFTFGLESNCIRGNARNMDSVIMLAPKRGKNRLCFKSGG